MAIFGSKKDAGTNTFDDFLLEGETVKSVYALFIDQAVLTDKRIIFADNKAGSNTLSSTVTIPFTKIDSIILEKKLVTLTNKLTIVSRGKEYELKFNTNEDVLGFYKEITKYICD
ncbi:PH domain-containing protein [Paenibacillus macerans]|uniref:PH domain-containing protein n=1 Tax=Paenibacillus macerans TaxID=44252 RepID=UPI003D31F546